MNRRRFLRGATSGIAALLSARFKAADTGVVVYVNLGGNDAAAGNRRNPVRTVGRALELAERLRSQQACPVTVRIAGGCYELEQTLTINAGASRFPLIVEAEHGETVTLSGGSALTLKWTSAGGGVFKADVPAGTTTDQLFVNGKRQVLARYPNFDPLARYLGGTSADALSSERIRRWANPAGGYVHALQKSLWGSLHYEIAGKTPAGDLNLSGGWQIDRDQPRSTELLFVEGIREELDAPGEWFLDAAQSVLYYYPPADVDLKAARVEIVRLETLVHISGTPSAPTRNVRFSGIYFRNTLRTFMKTREQLLRSDWRIYRGGAVLLENSEDISMEDCVFDQVGGNAVFVSGRNRRVAIRGCHIIEAGASGVCFVGKTTAVRNALQGYESTQSLEGLDHTAGPTRDGEFPDECTVEDCLIERTGRIEKQTAGVTIDAARRITVRHTSIYGVPRAGINIGDGAWGGHRIEGCDVFDTVLETSDHGAFNAWGRDRWWHLRGVSEDTLLRDAATSDLPTLDAVEPNWLKGNRWACEHGWDIDLDDGSSNYRIEDNLCLSGGIKLREGFLRQVLNNVCQNNTLHVHVWPSTSKDVVERNIVFVPYRPVRPHGWGASFDFNFLQQAVAASTRPALELQQLSGQDAHSLTGDADFRGAEAGDFSLSPDSPARKLGIRSLGTPRYGVGLPNLRTKAQRPDLARLRKLTPATLRSVRRRDSISWMGATVRNLLGLGEMSELGAPTESGVIAETVQEGSAAAIAGLKPHDLLVGASGKDVRDTTGLRALSATWSPGEVVNLRILRAQQPLSLKLTVPGDASPR